jgi:hypothetical protein
LICPADILSRYSARIGLRRRATLRGLLDRAIALDKIAADMAPELPIDVVYGVLWYRRLLDHAPLDEAASLAIPAHPFQRLKTTGTRTVARPPWRGAIITKAALNATRPGRRRVSDNHRCLTTHPTKIDPWPDLAHRGYS